MAYFGLWDGCIWIGVYSDSMQTLDSVFRALGDPTRLRILCFLRDGETCVGDLVQLLGVSQPMASRHLASLRAAGLVQVRRRGLWAFYSLAPAEGEFHGTLMDCLDAGRAESPELKKDACLGAALRRSGGCCPVEPAGAPGRCQSSQERGATGIS